MEGWVNNLPPSLGGANHTPKNSPSRSQVSQVLRSGILHQNCQEMRPAKVNGAAKSQLQISKSNKLNYKIKAKGNCKISERNQDIRRYLKKMSQRSSPIVNDNSEN